MYLSNTIFKLSNVESELLKVSEKGKEINYKYEKERKKRFRYEYTKEIIPR
jgi:hypothetical protein